MSHKLGKALVPKLQKINKKTTKVFKCAKDLNSCPENRKTLGCNKNMKRRLTSLVIKEIKIKITMR